MCVQSSPTLSKVVHHFEGEAYVKCVQTISWTTDTTVAGHMRPAGCSSLQLGNLRINQSKRDRILNFAILNFKFHVEISQIHLTVWDKIHSFIHINKM